jgi:protocatechuate 3,4-dioxygenase alpha subunit
MTSDPTPFVASPSQTVGPFFHFGLAPTDALGQLAGDGTRGERIRLRVRVLDGDGIPLPDALVEIYQADADGAYGRPPFSGFGRLATIEDGTCVFETIYPGRVADGRGAFQAPHVNVCLFARGLQRHVYTRIYFAGDEALRADPLLTLVPEDRRSTLIASAIDSSPGRERTWEFVIRLQGNAETVFFDL